MRASRYILFMYTAMILTPAALFGYALTGMLGYTGMQLVFQVLLVPFFLAFGILSYIEVYAHRGASVPRSFYKITTTGRRKEQTSRVGNEVMLNIKRFNHDAKHFEESSHSVKVGRFTTVLDALLDIKERQDGTLAMRYSCRMGICGSCAMVVNGKPVLACETSAAKSAVDNRIEVGPMQAHPMLRDLVTDFDDFFGKHSSLDPHLYRKDEKEQWSARELYKQTHEEVNRFLPYSYCIMCGLCMDACPVVNSNPEFVGPQALSQAYRYHKDSRDQMKGRLTAIDKITGAWGCEFAGACSEVCPKGVDPASAIQLLKAEVFEESIETVGKNDA